MRYSIGDKVAVLDDVLKGTVVQIEGTAITVETEEGFPMVYREKELVLIGKDQADLSKFSDISNEDLMHKSADSKLKKKSLFKSDQPGKNQPIMEVDLHIHQLTSSTRGMDNYDMLNVQITTAKQKLEYAIRNRIPKVVFIHGKGEGVLKNELEFLLKKYPVDFYEASFQKYGLGATEVYIYQNPKR